MGPRGIQCIPLSLFLFFLFIIVVLSILTKIRIINDPYIRNMEMPPPTYIRTRKLFSLQISRGRLLVETSLGVFFLFFFFFFLDKFFRCLSCLRFKTPKIGHHREVSIHYCLS